MAQNLIARALPNQLGAQPDRYINGILQPGVWDLAGNHYKVVVQASPGMSVRCGSGAAGDMAVVTGAGALSGRYIVQNQDAYVGSGNTDLSIGNGDPSDPRIDLIVLRVYDDEMDSSGLTVARLEVVPGTPASSPAVPATPAGALALARVAVDAGESVSITSGDITDVRGQSTVARQLATVTQVRARAEAAGSLAIGTSATVMLSATLTIPADWVTWDLDVAWQQTMSDTSGGTTGTQAVTIEAKLNGVVIGQAGVHETQQDNTEDVAHVSGVTYVTGKATTGAHTVTLVATRGATYTLGATNRVLMAVATRTS